MKKIFIKFSAPATLALAIALGSCNNAEEVKKQSEAQATQIQTAVDEQLNGLQEQVNAECTALVDSLANVQYVALLAEAKRTGKKVVTKVKTKVVTKTEPKPTVGDGKPKMGQTGSTGTVGDGKPKMGETGGSGNTIGSGKPKMGTSPK